MKILIAVNDRTDPGAACRYLAKRFDKAELEVDVLAAIQLTGKHDSHDVPEYKAYYATVLSLANELRQQHGISCVRTHIEHGQAAEIILVASQLWRSSLILMETGDTPQGFMSSCIDSTARRVCRLAQCPVELFKPSPDLPEHEFTALVSFQLENLDSFPWHELRTMSWVTGSRIILQGVLKPVVESSRLAANPAALLRTMKNSSALRNAAEKKLASTCVNLSTALSHINGIHYEIVEGNPLGCMLQGRLRAGASLIVMCQPDQGNLLASFRSARLSFSTFEASTCPVLLLPRKNHRLRRNYTPTLVQCHENSP